MATAWHTKVLTFRHYAGWLAAPSAHRRSGRFSASAARLFSFPVMCMFLLSGVILAHSAQGIGIGESDIWWHLANSRNLFEHHSLSRYDMYTFTVAGSPWISFEWLSEIPFYLAYRAAGLQGILAVYSAVFILIYMGVYYRSWRAGANAKNAAVSTLAAICIGAVSLAPRTLLFGWLCMTGLLIVLDCFRRTGKGLWLLPPLFALWINLHGSWVFGMVILTISVLSGTVEGNWGKVTAHRWSPAQLKSLLIASAASVFGLFANPFGYKLVLYPIDFALHQQQIMRGSEYWLPIDFGTWNGKVALTLLFMLLAAGWFSDRRWRLDEFLLAAFALWAALSHLRFMDLAAIIITPILAPRLRLFPPYEQSRDKPFLNAAIMAAVVGWMVISFPSSSQLGQQVNDQYPLGALEFMRQHQLNGRLFNSVEFGGFIEWNMPELKPFVDGRGDIFIRQGILEPYAQITDVKAPFEILNRYDVRYALLERAWPLTYVLAHSEEWRLIYSDRHAQLFERVPAVVVHMP